jgi:DinB superfamily
MADKTLLMLLDDVRGKTLNELKGLDELHARWAPPNLQNSCLWHGGHAYVVTEFLTMKALGRDPSMPPGWLKMFSWESNPAHVKPESWPPLEDVVAALQEQYRRLRAVIGGLTEDQLDAPEPNNPARNVRFAISHGLHDEARHSGEISLLRKLMLSTFVVKPPTPLNGV